MLSLATASLKLRKDCRVEERTNESESHCLRLKGCKIINLQTRPEQTMEMTTEDKGKNKNTKNAMTQNPMTKTQRQKIQLANKKYNNNIHRQKQQQRLSPKMILYIDNDL